MNEVAWSLLLPVGSIARMLSRFPACTYAHARAKFDLLVTLILEYFAMELELDARCGLSSERRLAAAVSSIIVKRTLIRRKERKNQPCVSGQNKINVVGSIYVYKVQILVDLTR